MTCEQVKEGFGMFAVAVVVGLEICPSSLRVCVWKGYRAGHAAGAGVQINLNILSVAAETC